MRTTDVRYMGRHRLICVGTRFRNLCEKFGEAGDQAPSEDRGDPEEKEDAGEYIAKLCLNDASREGAESWVKMSFSSSIGASGLSELLPGND